MPCLKSHILLESDSPENHSIEICTDDFLCTLYSQLVIMIFSLKSRNRIETWKSRTPFHELSLTPYKIYASALTLSLL